MKQLKFLTPDDFTRENIEYFKKTLSALENEVLSHRSIKESGEGEHFNNIGEWLKYHNAIPFDEYVRKIKAKYARYF